MNAANASAVEDEILCPIDGRRSSKELYAKFFIVNIATLAFYFHFIRRRDGTYLSWSSVLFFLAPLNLVFRYAVALIGIFGYYAVYHASNYVRGGPLEGSWNIITPSLNWLFGRSEEYDEYAPVPTSDDTDPIGSTKRLRKEKISFGDIIGRVLVNGIFLAQCSGTIILYYRRRQNKAVTMLDQKTFEAAFGGFAICVMNICLSLGFPIFADYVPAQAKKTRLDRFALFWRDSCRKTLCPFGKGVSTAGRHWIRFSKNLVISTILVQLFSMDSLFSNFMELIFGWHRAASGKGMGLPSLIIILASCLAFPFGCLTVNIFYNDGRDRRGSENFLSRNPRLLWIAYPIGGALGSLYGILITYLIFGCLYVFQVRWAFSYFLAFGEVSRLSHAPLNQTCPLLWSDPMANWVWGLA